MLSDSVDQKPIMPMSDGKNTGQKSAPQPSSEGWSSSAPNPSALTAIQASRTNAPTRTKGAAQFSKWRRKSMPRWMIAICAAQKSRKHSHSGQGLPAIRAAFSQCPPVSSEPRAKMPLPPIQVWMPNQPQATAARMSAGRFAPRSPKEARARTGKGMPYLGPAWPVASIGSRTMTLARAMVNTACFQSMPSATSPEARVQLGMQWAMEIHSAAKL